MTQVMDSVARALRKRAANVAREEKIAAGTAINPRIDSRLNDWAGWYLGENAECGGAGSMLAALIASGGEMIRSTAGGFSMPDDIYDTDRAVMTIDEKYRQAIFQKYLEVNKNDEQRGAVLGVTGRTFRRYLLQAQHQILFCLKTPPRKALTRERMLRECQR